MTEAEYSTEEYETLKRDWALQGTILEAIERATMGEGIWEVTLFVKRIKEGVPNGRERLGFCRKLREEDL